MVYPWNPNHSPVPPRLFTLPPTPPPHPLPFKSDCGEVKEEDFVLDEDGNRKVRMTQKKDHFSFTIGDTRGYSDHQGGGTLTQHFNPARKSHRSLKETLQQPIDVDEVELRAVDGAKDMLMNQEKMHLAKQAIFKYWADHGELPPANDAAAADEVVENARGYAASMQGLVQFCGKSAALAQFDKEEPTEEMKGWGMTKGMSEKTNEFTADVESMVRKLALTAAIELQPMTTLFGGIVAQEIVKFGGKFTPLTQWLQIDCMEVLPNEQPADTAPQGSRYDHNIAMFGAAFQEKLGNGKTFMVGCGALGCEFFKNFAMLGFACGEDGCISVTDNDRIEVSNLNRQFLFREHNVGQPKSVAAAVAAKSMNANIKVNSKQLLAMPATEDTFNDAFWESQDFVTNALDSVTARKYVDGRCVFYGKPLFESGTEGTKFNSMVILPHLTQTYTDGPEDTGAGNAIPMCTLRNFPSTIIHCIEWAKAQFVDVFEAEIDDVTKYLEDPATYISDIRAKAATGASATSGCVGKLRDPKDRLSKGLLRGLRNAQIVKTQGYAGCVQIALEVFYDRFNLRIKDLQHHFPRDKVDDKSGKAFWAPPKRYPDALVYGGLAELGEDEEYAELGIDTAYIVAAANMFAAAYGLVEQPMNYNDERGVGDTFVPEDSEWRSVDYNEAQSDFAEPGWGVSNIKIETEEDEKKGGESKEDAKGGGDETEAEEFERLMAELEGLDTAGLKAAPADFEKDLDLNFHIDFIFAAANLRACNYGIRPAPRHKCKMIAGKIIPAIATSTACATALICIEMLKLMQGDKEMEQYRASSNNFAMNMFQMAEPNPVDKLEEPYEDVALFGDSDQKVHPVPAGYTKWDKTKIEGAGLTVGQFVEQLEKQAGVKCSSLAHPSNAKFGGAMIYDANEKTYSEHKNTNHKAAAFRKQAEKANERNKKRVAAFEEKIKVGVVDAVNATYGGAAEGRSWLELEGTFKTLEGEEASIPPVVYKY